MKTVEVLYNQCYGGFSLSKEAVEKYNEWYGVNKSSSDISEKRHDPYLIALYKEYGSEWMSGECAEIAIIKLVDVDGYRIQDYDGKETIEECYADFILV